MKLLASILLCATAAFAQTSYVGTGYVGTLSVPSSSSPASYLVDEGFESAGTPYPWGSTTADFDNTGRPGPINGAQSLRVPNGERAFAWITNGPFFYSYAQFRISAAPPSGGQTVISWRDESSNFLSYVSWNSDNTIQINGGSGTPTKTTTATINTNLTVHWFYYHHTNGNAWVDFSTNGTKTAGKTAGGSGAKSNGGGWAWITNHTRAGLPIQLNLHGNYSAMWWDRVLVSTNEIGDAP